MPRTSHVGDVQWGPAFQDKIIQLVTAGGDDPARASYGAPAYPEAYPYIAAGSAVAVAALAMMAIGTVLVHTQSARADQRLGYAPRPVLPVE